MPVQVFSLFLAGTYLFLSSSDMSVSRERSIPSVGGFGSIAVLPFVDMSEDQSQRYLGDGIAEELIHRIAGVPDVRVVARTSSFLLRHADINIQGIGDRLGADVVLEGSIRRSGDQLRITAQLIDTSNGYHIWSHSYEPIVADAFAVQDQIAGSVAQLLQSGVEGDATAVRSWTQSTDAANAYYLGMFHMHKRRAESLNKSLEYFQQAITSDPQFALAYAGLAKAYSLASDERYGSVPDAFAMENSHAAIHTARLLDDRLPEVLEQLAGQAWHDEDLSEAEALILRAIDVNPNYAPAYKVYGQQLAATGRMNESILARRKAVEIDPLSPVLRLNLALAYRALNRLAEAETEILTAIELDPTWHIPYQAQALLMGRRGQLARSIELNKKAITVEGPQATRAGEAAMSIGYSYLTLGDYVSAAEWFGEGEKLSVDGWFHANHLMHLFLAQDKYQEADSWLTHWASAEPDQLNILSLGGLYRAMMGQDEEAAAMIEHALALAGDGSQSNLFDRDFVFWGYIPTVHLARLRYLAGATDQAEQLLKLSGRYIESLELESPAPGTNYVVASIHALRGNNRDALASLRAAVEGGWSKLWFIERDPIFAEYHGDPDFESIIELMKARLASESKKLVQVAEAAVAP